MDEVFNYIFRTFSHAVFLHHLVHSAVKRSFSLTLRGKKNPTKKNFADLQYK